MKKIFVVALLLSTFNIPLSTLNAQEVDLTIEELADLELDYKGAATASSAVGTYADLTYWTLFAHRWKGWNGGRGGFSTPLPDGNVFWSFGDSYFGMVSEFRNRKQRTSYLNNMPHNAGMIQMGEESDEDFLTLNEYVSTDKNNYNKYYLGRTWVKHPESTLSSTKYNMGRIESDYYYRPGDAVVVNINGANEVQMMLFGYNADGECFETSVARFSLSGEPGDEDYMKLKDIERNVVPFTTNYGCRILEDDGHLYLYGSVKTTSTHFDRTYVVVARTSSMDLCSQWEYYIKDADGTFQWTTEVPTLEQMQKSNIALSSNTYESPSVFKYGGNYYLCGQMETDGVVYLSTSKTPYGTFSNRKNIYKVPAEQSATSNLFVHPQLSRTGELVFSYNMDPVATVTYRKGTDGKAVATEVTASARNFNAWESADLCQSHFVRVFNWQKMFNVENIGPMTDAGLESFATGINLQEVSKNNTSVMTGVYNINGQKVNENYHGIVIKNGKKIIR